MLIGELMTILNEAVADKSNPHTVTFNYVKKNGEAKIEANIGPYEVKEGFFWGDKGGETRKFALERISNMRIDAGTFSPRFDIKLGDDYSESDDMDMDFG